MSFGEHINPDDSFDTFLDDIANNATSGNDRFICRNFLLDENVPSERLASYQGAGAMVQHADMHRFEEAHNKYLSAAVYTGTRRSPVGRNVIVDRHTDKLCPETFRFSSLRGHLDPNLDLIRVVDAGFLEAKQDKGMDVIGWTRQYQEGTALPLVKAGLESTLKGIWNKLDLRPVWAAYFMDVEDLFGDTADKDHPDWADCLRDRLGLAHFDPKKIGRDIDIILFKYKIKDVPKFKGEDIRAITTPSVLDATLNSAFCPAPQNCDKGYALDLNELASSDPYGEIVHASFPFKCEHVFRIGTIHKPAPSDLAQARQAHLRKLRVLLRKADYAESTDGPLS